MDSVLFYKTANEEYFCKTYVCDDYVASITEKYIGGMVVWKKLAYRIGDNPVKSIEFNANDRAMKRRWGIEHAREMAERAIKRQQVTEQKVQEKAA